MTDLRFSRDNQGGHGDAAVYLLGALDEVARGRFEAHAASCEECQRELRALQPVADQLALAVPQVEPPRHLLTNIVASARAVAGTLGAQPAAPEPLWAAPAAPAAVAAASQRKQQRWWHWTERASNYLAPVALFLAVAGGGYALFQHQEVQHTAETAAQLSETLALMYQPGQVARTLTAADGSSPAKGKLFLAPDTSQAVLLTYDLPKLPGSQAYQLWLNNPDQGKRDSGGLFQVDDKGRGHLIVHAPQALAAYRNCGVTQEPKVGSKWPTGQRVLTGEI
jgi:hypothetical protein